MKQLNIASMWRKAKLTIQTCKVRRDPAFVMMSRRNTDVRHLSPPKLCLSISLPMIQNNASWYDSKYVCLKRQAFFFLPPLKSFSPLSYDYHNVCSYFGYPQCFWGYLVVYDH